MSIKIDGYTDRTQSLASLVNKVIAQKQSTSSANTISSAGGGGLVGAQFTQSQSQNQINSSYGSYLNSLQDTIDSLNKKSSSITTKLADLSTLKNSYSNTASSLDSFLDSVKNSYAGSNYDYTNTNPNSADVDLFGNDINSQRVNYNVIQVATSTTATSNYLNGLALDGNTKIKDLFANSFDGKKIISSRKDINSSMTMAELGIKTGSFEIGGNLISINSSDTVQSVFDKLKINGYDVSFDDQNRLTISSDSKSLKITNQTTNFGEVTGLTISEGTFSINGQDLFIGENTTVNNLVDTINSDSKFGVAAILQDGKLQLIANKTGNILIDIAKGTSNFTNAIGFTSGGTMRTDNLVLGSVGKKQTLTGSASISASSTGFSQGSFTITSTLNGSVQSAEIKIDASDSINNIIDKINNSSLNITASIVDGKFQLSQNVAGSGFNITVEAGTSDFTKFVGLTDDTSSTGILSPGLDSDYFTRIQGSKNISDINTPNVINAGSFKINGTTVQLTGGSIQSALDDINRLSEELGVVAEFKENRIILRNRLTGTAPLFIEGGTSNFGSVSGLTTESTSAATSVLGRQGAVSTLTGAESVSGSTQVGVSSIKINGTTVNIAAGSLDDAIANINAVTNITQIKASISGGKLVLSETRNGALSISVEDVSGNFGQITGIIGYSVSAGEEEKYGSSKTKVITSRIVNSNMQISNSTVQINGQSINVGNNIGDAINTINANSSTTGVEAFIDLTGQFTLRNIVTGSASIDFKVTSGDIGRVIGTGTYSVTGGSSSQVEKEFAKVTGSVEGLDKYSQILKGSTITINGTTIDAGETIEQLINNINAKSATTQVAAGLTTLGQLQLTATVDTMNSIQFSTSGVGDLGRVTGLGSYQVTGSTNDGAVSGQSFSRIKGTNNVALNTQILKSKITLHYVNDAGVDSYKTYDFTSGSNPGDATQKIITLQDAIKVINDSNWYVRAEINTEGKFEFVSRAVGDFNLSLAMEKVDGVTGDFGRVIGMATHTTLAGDPSQQRKDPATITGGTSGLKLTDEIIGSNSIKIWMTRSRPDFTGTDTEGGSGSLASVAQTITFTDSNGNGAITLEEAINQINAKSSITKVKASLINGQFVLTQIDQNTAGEGDTINYTLSGSGDFSYITGFGTYVTPGQSDTGSMAGQRKSVMTGSIAALTGNEQILSGSINITGLTIDNTAITKTIALSGTINNAIAQINASGAGVTASLKDGKFTLTSDYFTELGITVAGDTDFLRVAGLGSYNIGAVVKDSGTGTDLGTHNHGVTKSTVQMGGTVESGTLTIDGVSITVDGKTTQEIVDAINAATNSGGQKVARAQLSGNSLTIQLERVNAPATAISATGDAARVLGLADFSTTTGAITGGTGSDNGTHNHGVTTSYAIGGYIANGSLTIDGKSYSVIGKSAQEIANDINAGKDSANSGTKVAQAQFDTSTGKLIIQVLRNGSTYADIKATGDAARVLGLGAYTTANGLQNNGSATDNGTHTHGVSTSYYQSGGSVKSGTLTIQGVSISVVGKNIDEIITAINATSVARAEKQGDKLVIQSTAIGALNISATGDTARVTGLADYSTTTGESTGDAGTDNGNHTHAVIKSTTKLDGRAANGTLSISGVTFAVENKTVEEIKNLINLSSVARAELNTSTGQLTIQISKNGSTSADIVATGDAARILGLAEYSTVPPTSTGGTGTDNGNHTHGYTTSTVKLGTGTIKSGTLTLDGVSIDLTGLTMAQVMDKIKTQAAAVAVAELNGDKLNIQLKRDNALATAISATGDAARVLGLADYSTVAGSSTGGTGTDNGTHNHGITTSYTITAGNITNGTLTIDGAAINVQGKTAAEVVAEINKSTVAKAEYNASTGKLIIQVLRNGSTGANVQATGDAARVLGLGAYSISAGIETIGSATDKGSHSHGVSSSTFQVNGSVQNGTLTIQGVNISVSGKNIDEIISAINATSVAKAEKQGGKLVIQATAAGNLTIAATGDTGRVLGLADYSVLAPTSVGGTGTDNGNHTHGVNTSTVITGGTIKSGAISINGTNIQLAGLDLNGVVNAINNSGVAKAEIRDNKLVIQATANGSSISVSGTGDAARVLGVAYYSHTGATSTAGTSPIYWQYNYDVWTKQVDGWDITKDYAGYDSYTVEKYTQTGQNYTYRSADEVWENKETTWSTTKAEAHKNDANIRNWRVETQGGKLYREVYDVVIQNAATNYVGKADTTETKYTDWSIMPPPISTIDGSWKTEYGGVIEKKKETTEYKVAGAGVYRPSGYGAPMTQETANNINPDLWKIWAKEIAKAYDITLTEAQLTTFNSYNKMSYVVLYDESADGFRMYRYDYSSSYSDFEKVFNALKLSGSKTYYREKYEVVTSAGSKSYILGSVAGLTNDTAIGVDGEKMVIIGDITYLTFTSKFTVGEFITAISKILLFTASLTSDGRVKVETRGNITFDIAEAFSQTPNTMKNLGLNKTAITEQRSTEWGSSQSLTHGGTLETKDTTEYRETWELKTKDAVYESRSTGFSDTRTTNLTVAGIAGIDMSRVTNVIGTTRTWYQETYFKLTSSTSYNTDVFNDPNTAKPAFQYANTADTQYRNVTSTKIEGTPPSKSRSVKPAGAGELRSNVSLAFLESALNSNFAGQTAGTVKIKSSFRSGVESTLTFSYTAGESINSILGKLRALKLTAAQSADGKAHSVFLELDKTGGYTDGYFGAVTIEDSGNALKLLGLATTGTTSNASNTASTNTDWNGIKKGQATLTGSASVESSGKSFAGQATGNSTFDVYLGTLKVGTVSYNASTTIDQVRAQIEAMSYDYNTGKTTTANGGLGLNDDNAFLTGNLETGTNNNGYVGSDGKIHYTGQLQTKIVGGKIVITSDVYATTKQEISLKNDTGSWTKLAGFSAGSWTNSKTNSTNSDWQGVTKGSSSLQSSANIQYSVKSFAGQKAGSFDIFIGSQKAGTVTYTAADTIDSIIAKINIMSFDYNTGKTLTANGGIGINDDDSFKISGNGKVIGGTVWYTTQLSASRDATTGKIKITSEIYDTTAQKVSVKNDTGNWTALAGLSAGTINPATGRVDSINSDWNGINKGTATKKSSVTGLNGSQVFFAQQAGSLTIQVGGSKNSAITISYAAGDSIQTILSKINGKTFTHSTGKFVSSPFTGLFLDDDASYKVGGNGTLKNGEVQYTGTLSASLVGGQIVITSDVFDTTSSSISITDTGNWTQLTGINAGSWNDSRTDATNTDWNGIKKGQATLTGSAVVKTQDFAGQLGGSFDVYLGTRKVGAVSYTASDTIDTIVAKINALSYVYSTGKTPTANGGLGINDDNAFNTGKLEDGSTQSSYIGSDGKIYYTGQLQASINLAGKIVITSDVYDTTKQEISLKNDTGNWSQLAGFNAGNWKPNAAYSTNTDWNGIDKGVATKKSSVTDLKGTQVFAGQIGGKMTFTMGGYSVFIDYTAGENLQSIVDKINNLSYVYATGKSVSAVGSIGANDDNAFLTGNLETGTNNNGYVGTDGKVYYTAQLQASIKNGQIVITSDIYDTTSRSIVITDTGNVAMLTGLNAGSWTNSKVNSTNTDWNGVTKGTSTLTSSITVGSAAKPFAGQTAGSFDIYIGTQKAGTVTYAAGETIDSIISKINAMSFDYNTGRTLSPNGGIGINDDNNFVVNGNGKVKNGTVHYTTQLDARYDAASGKIIITSEIYDTTAKAISLQNDTGNWSKLAGFNTGSWSENRVNSTNSDWNGITKGIATKKSSVQTLSLGQVFSGQKAGVLTIKVGVNNVNATVSYTASDTIDTILKKINDLFYDYATGKTVSTPFTNGMAGNDDNAFLTGNLETGSNNNGYVDSSGKVHYTAQLQAKLVNGQIVITSDVYDTTTQNITITDTGNWSQLTGLNAGSWTNSRTDTINTDWNGIRKDTASLTSSIGGMAGSTIRTFQSTKTGANYDTFDVYVGSHIAGTVRYNKDSTVQQILDQIKNFSYVFETNVSVSTPFTNGMAANDDNAFVTGKLEDGSTANGYVKNGKVEYTAQLDAKLVNGKIVITSDVYDTTAQNISIKNDTAKFSELSGIADGAHSYSSAPVLVKGDEGIYTYNGATVAGLQGSSNLTFVGGSGKGFWVTIDDGSRTDTGNTVNLAQRKFFVDVTENDTVQNVLDKMTAKANGLGIGLNFSATIANNKITITTDGKYGEQVSFSDDTSGFIVRAGLATTNKTFTENKTSVIESYGYDRLTGSVNTITKNSVLGNLTSETFTISGGNGTYNITIAAGDSIQNIIDKIFTQSSGHYKAGLFNKAQASYDNASIGEFYIESTAQTPTDTTVTSTDLTRRLGLVSSNLNTGPSSNTSTGDHGYFNYQSNNVSGLKENSIISGLKNGKLTFTLHSNNSTGQTGSITYRPTTSYTIDVVYNDTAASILNKMKLAILKEEDERLEHSDVTDSNRLERLDFKVVYDSVTNKGHLSLQIIGNYASSITFDSDTSGFSSSLGLDKANHSYSANYSSQAVSSGKSMITGSVGNLNSSQIFGNMAAGTMTLSSGSTTKTINIAATDRIQDVIDKINEGGLFTAGLDANKKLFIKTNSQSTSPITISGTSDFASLAGLKAKSWTYTHTTEAGSADFSKITGSVFGLASSQKFNNMTSGSFSISASGFRTLSISVTKGVTTVGDVIDFINTSSLSDFKASLDDSGRMVIETKSAKGSTITVNKGTTNYSTILGLSSGTLGGNATSSSGSSDIYSSLKGSVTGLDSSARFSAGDFIISVKDSKGSTISKTFNITGNETLADIASLISNSNLGISAVIDSSTNSLVLKSKSAGAYTITLKDGTSNFAESTGFTKNGAQISPAQQGALSTLTSSKTVQNANALGFSSGNFYIALTDKTGKITSQKRIDISQFDTVDNILNKINSSGIGITASVSAAGKVVLTRNSSVSDGGILVTKGTSDFTNKIGFTSGGTLSSGAKSSAGVDSTKTVLSSATLGTNTSASTLASLGIKEGTFKINGISVSVAANDTINSLLTKINSVFNSNDPNGVFAEFKNNKVVLTSNSASGNANISIEKGSSNITDSLGFTNSSGISSANQQKGLNAIYTVNGQRYESSSNVVSLDNKGQATSQGAADESIRLTLKNAGSGVVDIGKQSLTNAFNKLNTFVNKFNNSMALANSSSLQQDPQFLALQKSIIKALTDNIGNTKQVTKELADIGITVYTSTAAGASNTKVSLSLNKDKFINAYLSSPDKVLNVLVGNDSKPIDYDSAGSFTRLSQTLNSSVSNYFTPTAKNLEAQYRSIAYEISSTNAELQNVKNTLAFGTENQTPDDLSDFLGALEAQYDSVNKLINKMKNQYSQTITGFVLNSRR